MSGRIEKIFDGENLRIWGEGEISEGLVGEVDKQLQFFFIWTTVCSTCVMYIHIENWELITRAGHTSYFCRRVTVLCCFTDASCVTAVFFHFFSCDIAVLGHSYRF